MACGARTLPVIHVEYKFVVCLIISPNSWTLSLSSVLTSTLTTAWNQNPEARLSLTPIPHTSPQLQLLPPIKLLISQEELPDFEATMCWSAILYGQVCYFPVCLLPILKYAQFYIIWLLGFGLKKRAHMWTSHHMDSGRCGFSAYVTFYHMGPIMSSMHVQFGCQMLLAMFRWKDKFTVFNVWLKTTVTCWVCLWIRLNLMAIVEI